MSIRQSVNWSALKCNFILLTLNLRYKIQNLISKSLLPFPTALIPQLRFYLALLIHRGKDLLFGEKGISLNFFIILIIFIFIAYFQYHLSNIELLLVKSGYCVNVYIFPMSLVFIIIIASMLSLR